MVVDPFYEEFLKESSLFERTLEALATVSIIVMVTRIFGYPG
jgi:hypothetical protein